MMDGGEQHKRDLAEAAAAYCQAIFRGQRFRRSYSGALGRRIIVRARSLAWCARHGSFTQRPTVFVLQIYEKPRELRNLPR